MSFAPPDPAHEPDDGPPEEIAPEAPVVGPAPGFAGGLGPSHPEFGYGVAAQPYPAYPAYQAYPPGTQGHPSFSAAGAPGVVVAARAIVWIQSGVWFLLVFLAALGAVLNSQRPDSVPAGQADTAYYTGRAIGAIIGLAIPAALGVLSIVLAARMKRGAHLVRTGTLILEGILGGLAILALLGSVLVIATASVPGGIFLLLLSLIAAAVDWTVFFCLMDSRARAHLAYQAR